MAKQILVLWFYFKEKICFFFSSIFGRIRVRYFTKLIRGSGSKSKLNGSATTSISGLTSVVGVVAGAAAASELLAPFESSKILFPVSGLIIWMPRRDLNQRNNQSMLLL